MLPLGFSTGQEHFQALLSLSPSTLSWEREEGPKR